MELLKIESTFTNNLDPDQTAPIGALWSGPEMSEKMILILYTVNLGYNEHIGTYEKSLL